MASTTPPREVRDAPVVGVLGFGRVGAVLARRLHAAGYRVLVAGSGAPEAISLAASVMAPGVEARWAAEVAESADLVILAVPLRAHRNLPTDRLDGKVVVDATNHWIEVDGLRDVWAAPGEGTSEVVLRALPGARLVKAFNHIGYHDLDDRARPAGSPARQAIAIATDHPDAARVVASLVDAVGFDPVPLGSLGAGRLLEPGSPVFGAAFTAARLREVLSTKGAESDQGC